MNLDSRENFFPLFLSAISNPVRISILNFCDDWKTIKEICNELELSQQSIHRHVEKLLLGDLLEAKRNGRRAKVYKRKHSEIRIHFSNTYY